MSRPPIVFDYAAIGARLAAREASRAAGGATPARAGRPKVAVSVGDKLSYYVVKVLLDGAEVNNAVAADEAAGMVERRTDHGGGTIIQTGCVEIVFRDDTPDHLFGSRAP